MRLTPKECAERMDCSASLVYALLKEGKLKAIRIGARGRGKWLIEESAIDSFLETCKPGSEQPPNQHKVTS